MLNQNMHSCVCVHASCCPHAVGEVVEQVQGMGQYLIRWADETTQTQDITHMFGKLTKKRGLRQGDHVLALAMPSRWNLNVLVC